MLIQSPQAKIGRRTIKLSKGSCKSYNITYIGICQICEKPYTGRTTDPLHVRTSGHRYHYNEILKKIAKNEEINVNTTSYLYSMGLHLYHDHGISDPKGFDKHYKFGILEIVNPGEIEKKEFKWMHQINSFQPHGINVEYPFGISYIAKI